MHAIKGRYSKTRSDRADYLQVDSAEMSTVCAVATQGYRGGTWRTTGYKVHISTDGVTWNSYKENNVGNVNINLLVSCRGGAEEIFLLKIHARLSRDSAN